MSNPLIVIPARKGSVRIPGKNTRLLNGIPLVKYTIDYAKQFPYDICVTTDDIQVWEIASKSGLAPLLRPDELCTSSAEMKDVIAHAVENNPGHDCVILLQPTSPFRSKVHLLNAIDQFEQSKSATLKSVNEKGDLNGSIFIYRIDAGGLVSFFEMSNFYSLDIDTPYDWFVAEQLAMYFEKQKIVWTGCETPA